MSSGIGIALNLTLARLCREQGFYCTSIVGAELLMHRDGRNGKAETAVACDDAQAALELAKVWASEDDGGDGGS